MALQSLQSNYITPCDGVRLESTFPWGEWKLESDKMTYVELQDHQVEKVEGANKNLYLVPATGDYVRRTDTPQYRSGGRKYEVLYNGYKFTQPSPVLGKRADTILMDDVTTEPGAFKHEWFDPATYSNKLSKDLENYILYGTATAPQKETKITLDSVSGLYEKLQDEINKPSKVLGMLNFGTKKEKDMEIGGKYCHLCGAELLQENRDTVFKAKHSTLRVVKLYECGTSVTQKLKTRNGGGYVPENKGQWVKMGEECVR